MIKKAYLANQKGCRSKYEYYYFISLMLQVNIFTSAPFIQELNILAKIMNPGTRNNISNQNVFASKHG